MCRAKVICYIVCACVLFMYNRSFYAWKSRTPSVHVNFSPQRDTSFVVTLYETEIYITNTAKAV